MKFVRALVAALRAIARHMATGAARLGSMLPGHPEPEPEAFELPEDPMVAKANAEVEQLRTAGDIPSHQLEGPARIANLAKTYAMSDEERRPFMTLKGMPPAQVGWLKSLGQDDLTKVASASHEDIWGHLKGVREIPGVTSFAAKGENHWLRARPYAGSNVVDVQVHLPQAGPAPQVESDAPRPQMSLKAFG